MSAHVSSVQNNISPAATFQLFFEEEVVNQILPVTYRYAQQRNFTGDSVLQEFSFSVVVSLFQKTKCFGRIWDDTNDKIVFDTVAVTDFNMSNLHCNDNTRLVDKADKYSRIRPLFDILDNKGWDYVSNFFKHTT